MWRHIQTYYSYSWSLAAYAELDGKMIQLPSSNNSRSQKDKKTRTKSITNEIISFHTYIDEIEVGETVEDFWQFQFLEKDETYTAGVVVEYEDGNSEMVEYEFTYSPPFELDISPDTMYITSDSKIRNFEITSNTSWTTSEDFNWLYVYNSYGNNDFTNSLVIDENTEFEERIGYVIIEGDYAPSCLLTIIQEGKPEPMPIPIDLLVDYKGYATWEEPESINDKDFIGYKVYLDGEYISQTENLYWQYTNLDQFTGYTAGITAVFDEGESELIEYEFVFHTANELEVNQISYIVTFVEGSEDLEITSTTNWEISCEANWVSFSQDAGNGNTTISIQYEHNPAGVRSTEIFISGLNTPIWKIKLIQAHSSTGGTPPPYNITTSLNEENGIVNLSWDFNQNASGFGFYEDFEDGTADNFIINDDRISIDEGYLKIKGVGEGHPWVNTYYDEIFSDFLIETTIIRTSGDMYSGSGFVIRSSIIYDDIYNGDGYLIYLSIDGQVGYAILDGTQYPNVSDWWFSGDINQGFNEENILSVYAHGDNVEVYINKKHQFTLKDDSYNEGYNRIAAVAYHSSDEVWFSDIAMGIDEGNRQYRDFTNFEIFRNDGYLTSTVDTFLTDQLPDYGNYQYQIKAIYDDGESNTALSDSIQWMEFIPPPNTIIYISPTNQDVDSTGLFTTIIEIEDAINLGHFSFEVLFNSSLINVTSVSLRDFITSTGRTIFSSNENINNDYGFIEYAVSTSGDGVGPDGNGRLFSIDWRQEIYNNKLQAKYY